MKNTNINEKVNSLVSVLMPVYNAEQFVAQAIESVLNQTHQNFELICVDDGSQDKSYSILESYAKKDTRIKVFQNEKNTGIGYTRRKLVGLSKGTYIAILDADDIMMPQRLEKQFTFLEKNPDVVVLGGQCVTIDAKGDVTGTKIFPESFNEIYKMMYKKMSIQQPTLMVNKSLVPEDFPWYDNSMSPVEDLDNLFRLFNYGKFANLPDFVLFYRVYSASSSLKNPKRTYRLTKIVRNRAVKLYGYKPTLGARVEVFLQDIVVAVLPAGLVFPLYSFLRGMKVNIYRSIVDGLVVKTKEKMNVRDVILLGR